MDDSLQWEETPSTHKQEACVMAIHGRGTNGEDLMPLADEINLPQCRWIFPHAPYPCPGIPGGKMWFGTMGEGADGIETSRALLNSLLDEIIQKDQLPIDIFVDPPIHRFGCPGDQRKPDCRDQQIGRLAGRE